MTDNLALKRLIPVIIVLVLVTIVLIVLKFGTGTSVKYDMGMVEIPGGVFTMGCSLDDTTCSAQEKPRHEVELDSYMLDKTPVTIGQYKKCVAANACKEPKWPVFYNKYGDNYPVSGITWFQAETFCGWAGKRLPTEAEWEYAVRAGSDSIRYGELNEISWWLENADKQIKPVGLKKPNNFGLYDMFGNVWEWCSDWMDPKYYQYSPAKNPKGAEKGVFKALRGGYFKNQERHLRASHRSKENPVNWYNGVGVRCAKNNVVSP